MAAPAPSHQEKLCVLAVSRATSAASTWCEQVRKGGLHLHPLEMSPGYFFFPHYASVLLSASHVMLFGIAGNFEITGNDKAFFIQGCGE